MCGLTAAIGKPGALMQNVFEDLFIVNQTRGLDSAGVASATLDGKVNYLKHTVWPHQLMRMDGYREIMNKRQDKNSVLIGHARAATKGSVASENAHPFMHDGICLVHNGTLITHLNHKGKRTDTDSESICKAIAERGIKKVWHELHGSATLIWYDKSDQSLNAISNGQRPLAYFYSEERDMIVLTSDGDHLRPVANFNEVKIAKNELYKSTDDTHLHMSWDDKKQIVVVEATKLEARPFPVVAEARREAVRHAFTGINTSTASSQSRLPLGPVRVSKDGTVTSVNGSTSTSVLPFPSDKAPRYHNANRSGLSRVAFNNIHKECFICEASLVNEYHTAAIVDGTHAACHSCTTTFGKQGIPLEAMKGQTG